MAAKVHKGQHNDICGSDILGFVTTLKFMVEMFGSSTQVTSKTETYPRARKEIVWETFEADPAGREFKFRYD